MFFDTVVFDLDNTLYDYSYCHEYALNISLLEISKICNPSQEFEGINPVLERSLQRINKVYSRKLTIKVLGKIKKGDSCECGKMTKLEYHHEIYPLTEKGIKKAYSNNQIIVICKRCHENLHSSELNMKESL
jgi:FMN phosphatase YigB (HAD superfamily)